MSARVFCSAVLVLATGCSKPLPVRQVATVKQLMDSTIHPAAEVIFDSVGSIISENGIDDFAPKNDDEWANVRRGAVTLAEAGNLLMLGDRPKDKAIWFRNASGLTDAAVAAIQAIDARNPEALFDAGGKVYEACQRCHDYYWKNATREQGR